MKGFLELNRNKIGFAFISTSLVFLTLTLPFLIVFYYNDDFPDLIFLSIIISSAGVGFPVFLLGLAYLEWLLNRRVRRRVFSVFPFNELYKIGFKESLINEKTRWNFTQETKEAIVNDFLLKCDVTHENPKIIEFNTLVEPKQIEKNELKRLSKSFSKQGVKFSYDEFTKKINSRRRDLKSVEVLEKDLLSFTETLKKDGFLPQSKNNEAQ